MAVAFIAKKNKRKNSLQTNDVKFSLEHNEFKVPVGSKMKLFDRTLDFVI